MQPDSNIEIRCVRCGSPFLPARWSSKVCAACHCPICSKIIRLRTANFCSLKCQQVSGDTSCAQPRKKQEIPRTCSACGNKFLAAAANRLKCPDCLKCEQCGALMGSAKSSRRFCGKACQDAWLSGFMLKNAKHFKRSPQTPDRIAFIRALGFASAGPKPHRRGPNNPGWKGGGNKTDRRREMERYEYKIWRATIFKRDGYVCAICGSRTGLQANHIKKWSDHPALRYEPANGIALCASHHHSTFKREHLFEKAFAKAVQNKQPVELTEAERRFFGSFITHCVFCGATIERDQYRSNTKRSFCNLQCMRSFETTLPFHTVNGVFVNRIRASRIRRNTRTIAPPEQKSLF